MNTSVLLNTCNHDRDSADMRYVYPVVSRRAQGVSVGINLNTNNACNWQCAYCQVPNLVKGDAPDVDVALLFDELTSLLQSIVDGDFMQQRVPEEMRRLNDIALSGNGEPTACREFVQVIEQIAQARQKFRLADAVKTVLISNGSLIYRPLVQQGLALLAKINGEIWFKLDRASQHGMLQVNHTQTSMDKVMQNLITASQLCPTWLQTCWFAMDGVMPSEQDENDYLQFLMKAVQQGAVLQGVLLYGLARPSMQPDAARLSPLSIETMQLFAERIKQLGLSVKISP